MPLGGSSELLSRNPRSRFVLCCCAHAARSLNTLNHAILCHIAWARVSSRLSLRSLTWVFMLLMFTKFLRTSSMFGGYSEIEGGTPAVFFVWFTFLFASIAYLIPFRAAAARIVISSEQVSHVAHSSAHTCALY
jgi:hypothetical protein